MEKFQKVSKCLTFWHTYISYVFNCNFVYKTDFFSNFFLKCQKVSCNDTNINIFDAWSVLRVKDDAKVEKNLHQVFDIFNIDSKCTDHSKSPVYHATNYKRSEKNGRKNLSANCFLLQSYLHKGDAPFFSKSLKRVHRKIRKTRDNLFNSPKWKLKHALSPPFHPQRFLRTLRLTSHVYSKKFRGRDVSLAGWTCDFLRLFEIFPKIIFVRGHKWTNFWVSLENFFEKNQDKDLRYF